MWCWISGSPEDKASLELQATRSYSSSKKGLVRSKWRSTYMSKKCANPTIIDRNPLIFRFNLQIYFLSIPSDCEGDFSFEVIIEQTLFLLVYEKQQCFHLRRGRWSYVLHSQWDCEDHQPRQILSCLGSGQVDSFTSVKGSSSSSRTHSTCGTDCWPSMLTLFE